MTRVASLYLPHLAIERLRRLERPRALPEPRSAPMLPIDDDPGACSVPRGGGWRPGARWAQQGAARGAVEEQVAALPLHQRPPMRELGRRSEAADHPFKRSSAPGQHKAVSGPAPALNLVPMVLAEQIGQRQVIAAACPAAMTLGLTPGMAVTQARALIPDLDIRPADRAADAALLADLALHAVRHWTPTAAVSGSDGLWLDLSGVAHLHGGEARFCQRLVRFCRRFGLTARVTVASTPGAAHALARFGRDAILLVPGGQEAQALATLPPAALRLTPEATAAANRFGLDRIADLLPLPRGPLARRLGMASVRRLDEALGRVPEPIVPVVPQETSVARLRLLEPIGTAEAIEQVIGDLLTDLIRQLVERGRGVRALILTLERIDGSEQHLSIGTARATRDTGHRARLFHLRIDRVDPGDGIEAMRLAAPHTDPLGAIALAASLAGDDAPPDVAVLVDQIAGRVGEDALFTTAPVESDVPERAVRRWSPLAAPTGWPSWKRPVRLLSRPEPLVGVLALLPDAPPRRFTWRGKVHAVVAGDGPERIHGEWWRRDGEVWAVRDYFRVEDDTGARFWLFRRGDGVDAATGDLSWYLHGLFG
ncbi:MULTISPECIES: DNA polymerase Y family protein [unclassified Sphingomonas]|uniref:DNA polymerase Y family protein n=1 Tax=unclassified Sphingomonas TaxID=196159 RepID=UPI00285C707F|nr:MULTISPECIES: DNA polymerase Y family protein [unclassified Sphingomonas]MDR6116245.1 protein ImuB [Sphingomonas sp. SORGH_AS_0789]MDR6150080.1 protein ImuB [Sphingomonas sp. SORGH_AS_0742]